MPPPRRRVAVRRKTYASKAGLHFSIGRIKRMLHEGNYTPIASTEASVYLTAVLEYLTAELLELSGIAARDKKKKRINPRHIMMAIQGDDELKIVFPQAAITKKKKRKVPKKLHPLLKKKKKKE